MINTIKSAAIIFGIALLTTGLQARNNRPVVMLTGFWNPTGKMIQQFCTDSSLNPSELVKWCSATEIHHSHVLKQYH